MPSVFHGLGAADHYVRGRIKAEVPSGEPEWLYLGTSVLCPEVEAEVVASPVLCDYNAPVPLNLIYHGEWHQVVTTINRLNYLTYNRVRAKGRPGPSLVRSDNLKDLGKWILNYDDYELLLRWRPTAPSPAADDTPLGRMYYSAKLKHYRETTENNRVLEASLLFECYPFYNNATKVFHLFTEDPAHWGIVPAPE